MSSISQPNCESKNVTAIGVWKDNFSIILHHRGPTFHKLTLGRSLNYLYLNLEETVFALLRTNFVLVDYRNKNVIGPNDILNELIDGYRISELLKVQVYLAFQRLGRSPVSLRDSRPSNTDFDPNLYEFDKLDPKNDRVELHALLDFFKTLKIDNIGCKTELLDPVYCVDDMECFIAMPDSLVSNILDNLDTFNKIIAVSDLDSVYFLTLCPLIL